MFLIKFKIFEKLMEEIGGKIFCAMLYKNFFVKIF